MRWPILGAVVFLALSRCWGQALSDAPDSPADNPTMAATESVSQYPFHRVFYRLGCWLDRCGEYDKATSSFTKAIQGSEEPRYYGARACTCLKNGDYDKARADLLQAIRLNPDDAGAEYRVSPEIRLSDKLRQHGLRQVRQMLRDRPIMGEHVDEENFLFTWAVERFAGEDLGVPICWEPKAPSWGLAEHQSPSDDREACIRVSPVYVSGGKQGAERSWEELWSSVIFELHNIAQSKDFAKVNEDARAGRLAREDYVIAKFRIEHAAGQRTRAFYAHAFLPWAKQKKLETDPSNWFVGLWGSWQQVLKRYPGKSGYPWQPYGHYFDLIEFRRLYDCGKYSEALQLGEQLLSETKNAEQEIYLFTLIGSCQARIGQLEPAIEALSKAVRLDPNGTQSESARKYLAELREYQAVAGGIEHGMLLDSWQRGQETDRRLGQIIETR